MDGSGVLQNRGVYSGINDPIGGVDLPPEDLVVAQEIMGLPAGDGCCPHALE